MLSLLFVLSGAAHAIDGSGPVYLEKCSWECEMGGWRVEVSESAQTGGQVIQLIVQDTLYQIGGDMYQAGDTLVAEDVEVSDGYCVQFPTLQATAIIGNVYHRTGSSPLTIYGTDASTDPLFSHDFCMDDDLNFVLDVLDAYKLQAGIVIPEYCEDSDCLTGGGGIDPEDPGTGAGTYTDAAGNVLSFDDLVQPGSGGSTSGEPGEAPANDVKDDGDDSDDSDTVYVKPTRGGYDGNDRSYR